MSTPNFSEMFSLLPAPKVESAAVLIANRWKRIANISVLSEVQYHWFGVFLIGANENSITTATIPHRQLHSNPQNPHLLNFQAYHCVPGPHPKAPDFASSTSTLGGPRPPSPCSTRVVAGG